MPETTRKTRPGRNRRRGTAGEIPAGRTALSSAIPPPAAAPFFAARRRAPSKDKMELLDYLALLRDASPSEAPLSRADAIILAQLAYTDFSAAAGTLGAAIEAALRRPPDPHRFGFERKNDRALMEAARRSRRFGDLPLLAARSCLDESHSCQFAAYAVGWNDHTCIVAFRGTDESIAGWKENFRLACEGPVAAQCLSVEFLEDVCARFPGEVVLLGHSKGGNLALYAAAFCREEVQARVREVLSLDGPGLAPALLASPGVRRVKGRVRVYVPRGSLVGLLFQQPVAICYIQARMPSLLSHYPYFWRLEGGAFAPARAPTRLNAFLGRVMRDFIDGMPGELREQYIEAFFGVVASGGERSLPALLRAWRKSFPRMLRAGLDRRTRRLFLRVFRIFLLAWAGRARKNDR